MSELIHNRYYKRLTNLTLWPLVGFLCLVFVFVVSQIFIYYYKFVPSLLSPLKNSLTPESLSILSIGIDKIIINLSVWIIALMLVNFLLVYVIWNVKKLLLLVRENER